MRELTGIDSVAFNRSYVAWLQWGFSPTYYCCFDPAVLERNAVSLHAALACHPKTHAYLNDRARQHGFAPSDRITLVAVSPGTLFQSGDRSISDFGNVGASSLQILAALGYQRVVLVGVDGRYQPVSNSADARRNYFTGDYVVEGHPVMAVDEKTSARQWDLAARGCRDAGLDVVNASETTALTCFPQKDLTSALAWLRSTTAAETH